MTTKTTHTPGPWHIGMKPGPMIYGPLGEGIADMHVSMVPKTEHKANARLIAASPDLLAALEGVTNALRTFRNVPKEEQDWTQYDTDTLGMAFEAIAKAKGES